MAIWRRHKFLLFGVPRFAIDLATLDDECQIWDLNLPEMQEKALKLVEEQESFCLVGSPACTAYCQLQALNSARYKWSPEKIAERLQAADVHLRFVCEL